MMSAVIVADIDRGNKFPASISIDEFKKSVKRRATIGVMNAVNKRVTGPLFIHGQMPTGMIYGVIVPCAIDAIWFMTMITYIALNRRSRPDVR